MFIVMIFLLNLYFTVFWCLEVYPERPEVEYFNTKYLSNFSLSIRKINRTSPYYINVDFKTLVALGNNLTGKFILLELLSGRYIPTPIQMTYKLCDFLYNEPFLGQMYAKQFPANWTCPFPAGDHHLHNLVLHLENFPYNVPFTWGSYSVTARVDLDFYLADTKELIVKVKCFARIIQKPKNTLKDKSRPKG